MAYVQKAPLAPSDFRVFRVGSRTWRELVREVAVTPVDLLWHLGGLVAPALGLALLLWPAVAFGRRRTGRWSALAWLVLAGVLVLIAGLIGFGRDGRMATYAAMVVTQGTLVWWWRGR